MTHLLCLIVLFWLAAHPGINSAGAQDTLPAPPGLDAALKKSLKTGEHLGQALKGVQDRVIRKPATAELLLDVIEDMSLEDALKKSEEVSQLDVIIALFQNAFDAKSIELLKTRGLPYLYRWSDELKSSVDDESSDEFLYMMQLFAGYRTLEGAQRVMSAAEAEILSDHPLWPFVFDAFTPENDATKLVLERLARPLPGGEIAIGILDCANALAIEGGKFKHPFDQDEGVKRIANWLSSKDSADLSRAQSGAAAIPFLKHAKRNELLQTAVNHKHPLIQAEAGWALVVLGDRRGLRLLQSVARDVRYSTTAQIYLEELGEQAAIPKEAQDPDFIARATLCQYLNHPAEQGRAPDRVTIVDSRIVTWPPTKQQRRIWLLKAEYDANAGDAAKTFMGLIGAIPQVLPIEDRQSWSVDNWYGMFCALELQGMNDPRLRGEATSAAGLELLRKANPEWGVKK